MQTILIHLMFPVPTISTYYHIGIYKYVIRVIWLCPGSHVQNVKLGNICLSCSDSKSIFPAIHIPTCAFTRSLYVRPVFCSSKARTALRSFSTAFSFVDISFSLSYFIDRQKPIKHFCMLLSCALCVLCCLKLLVSELPDSFYHQTPHSGE